MTAMQRDHLKAEVQARDAGRPFCYVGRFRPRAPNANAHVGAWQTAQYERTVNDFIARYSL